MDGVTFNDGGLFSKSSLKFKCFRGVFKLGARVGEVDRSEDAIEDVFGEGVIELDDDSFSTAAERGEGVLSNTAFETRACMVWRTHPSIPDTVLSEVSRVCQHPFGLGVRAQRGRDMYDSGLLRLKLV